MNSKENGTTKMRLMTLPFGNDLTIMEFIGCVKP